MVWVGPNVCDAWNIMCAYDERACYIEEYALKREVLDPRRELFSLKF